MGRADPPCHVGMAVEDEADRTVPCVNVLCSYDMRSSVLRKAKDRHESKSTTVAREPKDELPMLATYRSCPTQYTKGCLDESFF